MLVAYEFLLQWYREWYENHEPEKLAQQKNSPIYRVVVADRADESKNRVSWRLTTSEKKRILLTHIYGVDIDRQAVEVTKLSLLLKMLEGEDEQTIGKQLQLMHDRVLPDLGNNIKCGNSLIGSDFYDNPANANLNLAERQRINAFDWEDEFPEIMKQGGFDAVIGNPPYLKLTLNNQNPSIIDYYSSHYKSIHGGSSKNLFQLFIERMIKTSPIYSGLIVPESLLTTSSNQMLRNLMMKSMNLHALVIFDHFVFEGATIGTTIFILSKQENENVKVIKMNSEGEEEEIKKIKNNSMITEWNVSSPSNLDFLFEKITIHNVQLKEIADLSKGMVVQDRKKHLYNNSELGKHPFVLGKALGRYQLNYEFYSNYEDLTIIGGTKDLRRHMMTPRLLIRRTGDNLCVAYSNNQELVESTVYILTSDQIDLIYLLGVLNSRLLTFYLKQKLITNASGYPQILMWQLGQLPILNPKTKSNIEIGDMIKISANQMIDLKNQLLIAKTSQDKSFLQRQIEQTDKKIDRLVYELYGLTDEEIAIVEGEG